MTLVNFLNKRKKEIEHISYRIFQDVFVVAPERVTNENTNMDIR